MALPKYEILIGGNWRDAAGGGSFETYNPYTGKPWALIPRCGVADAERAIDERMQPSRAGRGR
jgi:aldehyde dehydrogenase (NAD+)